MKQTAVIEVNEPPRFVLSRWLFLKLLAVIYFIAFGSLLPQIHGLIGVEGLLPIHLYLQRAFELWGTEAYYQLPTLLWVYPSDALLTSLCWLGVILSTVALTSIAPIPIFGMLWVLYLSLTIAGQEFLSFQWDILLLETGLLAVLYSPFGLHGTSIYKKQPAIAARWLIWGLAFKLTFLSGVTKLTSGDPTWRNFSALQYHYETQPLPNWISWHLHNTLDWFAVASVAFMFVIEIVISFVILFPPTFRKTRIIGCFFLCLLQIVIALSGNYGFFNLLTLVLYLSLLDDHTLAKVLPRSISTIPGTHHAENHRVLRPSGYVLGATISLLALLSGLSFVREIVRPTPMPAWTNTVMEWIAPIRSINSYGLFRTMTTERPEIVIEGSLNGTEWKEYTFRWKPSEESQTPNFVQPYMPRLDWQMWFAALSPQDNAHWLFPLAQRILENETSVLNLLGHNPFSEQAPRFVRFLLYRYRFSTPDDEIDGLWWNRKFVDYLTEPISRRTRSLPP